MAGMKTVSFFVAPSHPDFPVAQAHCENVRILRNGVNSILRTKYFRYRHGDSADFGICEDFGLTTEFVDSIGVGDHDALRKIVTAKQGVRLPVKLAQSAIRSLGSSWQSFYASRKKHLPANIPGYSAIYHTAEYNPQAISGKKLREGWIVPSGWKVGFELPEKYRDVRSARVTPEGDGFSLKVLYRPAETKEDYTPTPGLIAGVDPGLNNLFTIAFNDFREGIIVDGRPIKHVNTHYNAAIAALTSELDIEKNNVAAKVNKRRDKNDRIRVYRPNSSRLDRLWMKRGRKIKHYYTTATNATVKLLCEAGVETVVLGWNTGMKQRINIGRRNNRKFVQVPLKVILDDLAGKLVEAGIVVVWTEESYTSKSSFLDNDPLPAHDDGQPRPTFSGRRVKRGLYKSGSGVLMNADQNGAYNIIRKHDPHFAFGGGDDPSGAGIAGTGTVACRVRRVSFSY